MKKLLVEHSMICHSDNTDIHDVTATLFYRFCYKRHLKLVNTSS